MVYTLRAFLFKMQFVS